MRTAYSKRLFRFAFPGFVLAAAMAVAQEAQPPKNPPPAAGTRGAGPGVGAVGSAGTAGASFGGGGGVPATKSKLEEMLEKALKNNPDLRVAASKAQEAEAELNRTRLEVTRKVVRANAALDAAKTNVTAAEQRLTGMRQLAERNAVGREEVQAAEKELAAAKTELATAEGEAAYLLGEPTVWKQAHLRMNVSGTATEALWLSPDLQISLESNENYYLGALRALGATVSKSAAEAATNMRQWLDHATVLSYKDAPLTKVLEDLHNDNSNLSFVLRLDGEDPKVTLTLDDTTPYGAVLQALTDVTGVRFVVRDYGILVVGAKQALPADAVSAHDFWKARPAAADAPKKDAKNPAK